MRVPTDDEADSVGLFRQIEIVVVPVMADTDYSIDSLGVKLIHVSLI